MNTPIIFKDYWVALEAALEYSLKVDYPVYFYGIYEGGYTVDSQAGAFSNEYLIFKIFKGHAE